MPEQYPLKGQRYSAHRLKQMYTSTCPQNRGFIAISRIFYPSNDSDQVITYVTIGYDNEKLVDLKLWGGCNLSKVHCLEGVGEKKVLKNGYFWVDVEKFTPYDL